MKTAVSTMPSTRAAAEFYIALGWPVLPIWPIRNGSCACGKHDCKSPGKHPIAKLAPNGVKGASCDLDLIKIWWNKYPDANIAIATGEISGVFVVDIDPDKHGNESWDNLVAQYGHVDTVEQESGGGGTHYFFQYVLSLGNSSGKLGSGIDTRGDGGYIIVAPSSHSSGKRYAWEVSSHPKETHLAELPGWLLALLQEGNREETAVTFSSANGSDKPDLSQFQLSEMIRSTIINGYHNGSDRSAVDQSVISALVHSGASDDQILAVFQHYLIGKDGKFAEKGKHGESYLAHSINRARGYLMADTAVSQENETSGFSTFADIDRLSGSIEWGWPGWLANGYLHILASESGVGKSFIAMHIAGCFLIGMDWPDGQPFTGKTGKVLWCEAEAAQQLNKERALSLGLPLDRIMIPNIDPFRDIDLRNIQDKDAIRAAAFDEQIRCIFIDSLSGADPREENSSDKLSVLKWVAEIGRDSGKPILVTHHLNKPLFGDDTVTLNRLRGSTSITQMARIVWALDTPDLNDKENKRLFILKNNLAKFPEPLGVKIDQDVQFGPAPLGPQKYSELDRAVDFLQDLLAREPLKAMDIQEIAQETDISKSTLSRAKKTLGIKSSKQVDGWYWSLPILNEAESDG